MNRYLVGAFGIAAVLWASVVAGETMSTLVVKVDRPSTTDLKKPPIEATLKLQCLEKSDQATCVRSGPIQVPGVRWIQLPPRTAWEISLDAEGYWSSTEIVVVGAAASAEEGVRLELYPEATLAGRLTFSEDVDFPTKLTLRFRRAAGRSVEQQGTTVNDQMSIELEGDGRWEASVPAGVLDVQIRAPGFVPEYLWELDLRARSRLDLGRIVLEPGASVAGWVVTSGESPPRPLNQAPDDSEPASVELKPATEAPATIVARGIREHLDLRSLETTVDERGFFQFEGVPAGSYRLVVRKVGYADAEITPLEVHSGSESLLAEPVELNRPTRLEIAIDPPVSPTGTRWIITLVDQERSTEIAKASVGEDGWWIRDGLDPGRSMYLLVQDENGASWYGETIELEPFELPHHITLDTIPIQGTVRRGDEAVAAILWFGGRYRSPSIRIEANEDGRFEGFLPFEGDWALDASLGDEDQIQKAEPVEVRKRSGSRVARVDIILPEHSIRGEVVDKEDNAVSGAVVLALSSERRSKEGQAITDPDGTFELVGLRSGAVQVQARYGEQESAWLSVHLEKGREDQVIRLVIEDRVRVFGRVTSASGPTPGAWLKILPDLISDGPAFLVDAVSDGSGKFSFSVPASVQSVNVGVFAPGFGVRLQHFDLASAARSPIEIFLPSLASCGYIDFKHRDAENAFLVHNAVLVPLRLVSSWSQPRAEDGSRVLTLPVPAGRYGVCTSEALLSQDGGSCVYGMVRANENSRLFYEHPGLRYAETLKPQTEN